MCDDDCADYYIKNFNSRICDPCDVSCQKCSVAYLNSACTVC
jgi:hypothetical protein